jgi:CBS domain-containing protein
MSDRMNINSSLEKEFEQLKEHSIIRSIRSLQPGDTVATLDVTMRRGGLGGSPIRHVPIIELNNNQPNTGELKALISKLDVATLLSPPWELIPKNIIDAGIIDINSLTEDIKIVLQKTIKDAFPTLFSGETPQLNFRDDLGKAMDLLTDTYSFNNQGSRKTRRYRTIPVFNEQKTLIGMLSYIDVFREIKKRKEGHKSFLTKTVDKLLKEIKQKKDDIKTIGADRPIFDAIGVFDGVPYTHLPLTTDSDNNVVVIGIVDDVLLKTYEHQNWIAAFSDKSLVTLANLGDPIEPTKNVVSLDNLLTNVLDKFLLDDRPTAVLVGQVEGKKLYMEGIISYLDILKNFKEEFLSVGNRNQPSEQTPEF